MGIIKQGILGGFSGKVANVVGTSWKGIAVVKSQPLSVANPRTAAQVAQRNKLSACVKTLQPILSEVIKPLNDRFAGQMSGYNYALQKSIEAFDASGNMAAPENFKISRSTAKAQLVDAIAAEAKITKYKVRWTSDAGEGYALATDKGYLVGINIDSGAVAYSTNFVRSANQAFVEWADGEVSPNDELAFYLAFLRSDGTVGFAQSFQMCDAIV